MHKIVLWLLLGWFCMIAITSGSIFSENLGMADMVLEGGSTGNVPFPHHKHQNALNNNCQNCHYIFPQEKGVIAKLKQENTLKKKSVMNSCQACHRDLASQGKASGPTKCKACHSI